MLVRSIIWFVIFILAVLVLMPTLFMFARIEVEYTPSIFDNGYQAVQTTFTLVSLQLFNPIFGSITITPENGTYNELLMIYKVENYRFVPTTYRFDILQNRMIDSFEHVIRVNDRMFRGDTLTDGFYNVFLLYTPGQTIPALNARV